MPAAKNCVLCRRLAAPSHQKTALYGHFSASCRFLHSKLQPVGPFLILCAFSHLVQYTRTFYAAALYYNSECNRLCLSQVRHRRGTLYDRVPLFLFWSFPTVLETGTYFITARHVGGTSVVCLETRSKPMRCCQLFAGHPVKQNAFLWFLLKS